jgi:hypothetical protein
MPSDQDSGFAVGEDSTVIDENRAVAQPFQHVEFVAHEDDGTAGPGE